jgi:hypothetical protein
VRIWRARFRVLGLNVAIIGALAGGGLTAGQAARGAPPARSASSDSAPNPGRLLGAVSCVGSSFCIGVGPDVDTLLFTGPYSQVWNGTTMRTLAVPARSPGLQGLFGISCTSAKNCVAVGGKDFGVGGQLSDEWNGSSWKILPVPEKGSSEELNGVDCTGARSCIAVGSGRNFAVAQTWNGTSWRPMPRPVVPHGDLLHRRRFGALSLAVSSRPARSGRNGPGARPGRCCRYPTRRPSTSAAR